MDIIYIESDEKWVKKCDRNDGWWNFISVFFIIMLFGLIAKRSYMFLIYTV